MENERVIRRAIAVAACSSVLLGGCAGVHPERPASITTVTVTQTATVPVPVAVQPRPSSEPWRPLHPSQDPECAQLDSLRQQASDATFASMDARRRAQDIQINGGSYSDYRAAYDVYIKQQQAATRLQQTVWDMEAAC
jgi:hypothetical protein